MSTDRDTTRIVRSWLEEGRTTLPDWVRDDVFDRLPATPQRRSRGTAWRFLTMPTAAKTAIAAAAVILVAVGAFALLPRESWTLGDEPIANDGPDNDPNGGAERRDPVCSAARPDRPGDLPDGRGRFDRPHDP